MGWITVKDDNIRTLWRKQDACCDQGKKSCVVSLANLYEAGTPLCSCGEDMLYVRTEIYEES